MGGAVDWNSGLQELYDRVLNLTPTEWGFVWITVAAIFAWVWVMGGPQPRRSIAAGAAAVVTGLAVGVVFALLGHQGAI